jgi:hypothetical protein
MLYYSFLTNGPACNVEISRTQWLLLHHVVQTVYIEFHKD